MYEQVLAKRNKKIAAVVLAGGKGTRMKSSRPKVLHKIGSQPMIFYSLSNLLELGINNTYVVIGHKGELVKKSISEIFNCKFVMQGKPLGTAHALKQALKKVGDEFEDILVVNGDDSAFYSQKTLSNFLLSHSKFGAKATMMTLKLGDDNQLGKVTVDSKGNFLKIVEDKEYRESNLKTDIVNCGAYVFDTSWLKENIDKVPLSQKGEYYITELLNISKSEDYKVNLFTLKDPKEWVGVNSRDELKFANLMMEGRSI